MPNDLPYYQKKSFLNQQQSWYRKLKRSGFKDIEHTYPDGNSSHFTANWESIALPIDATIGHYNDNQMYYRLAGLVYWDCVASSQWNQLTQCVIYDHCQGESIRKLAKKHRISRWKTEQILNQFKELVISRLNSGLVE